MVEKMLTRAEFDALKPFTVIQADGNIYIRAVDYWLPRDYHCVNCEETVSVITAYDMFERFRVISLPVDESIVGPTRCSRVGCKHRILKVDGEWFHIDTEGYRIDHAARPPKHFTQTEDGGFVEVKE